MPSAIPPGSPTDPPDPSEPVYRDYSQAELDAQYNQATLVPDVSGYLDAWNAESARVRESQACRLSVPYGDGPDETLDIFPADNGDGTCVPIMLFIHGGAWRALSKDSFSYPAAPFATAGATWVAADFALLPDIEPGRTGAPEPGGAGPGCGATRAASAAIRTGSISAAIPPAPMSAARWSRTAGAPGPACPKTRSRARCWSAVCTTWSRCACRRATTMSDSMRSQHGGLSPIHNIPDRLPALALFWGSGELDEFCRQSRAFAEALWARGHRAEAMEIAGANHFDMADGFADDRSAILRSCLGMMGLL